MQHLGAREKGSQGILPFDARNYVKIYSLVEPVECMPLSGSTQNASACMYSLIHGSLRHISREGVVVKHSTSGLNIHHLQTQVFPYQIRASLRNSIHSAHEVSSGNDGKLTGIYHSHVCSPVNLESRIDYASICSGNMAHEPQGW